MPYAIDPASSHSALSKDAIALMEFQNNVKSVGVTYLLWFLLGGLGIHRFYLKSYKMGAALLLSTILGMVFVFPFLITGAIMLYDLFAIPSLVQKYNDLLLVEITTKERV